MHQIYLRKITNHFEKQNFLKDWIENHAILLIEKTSNYKAILMKVDSIDSFLKIGKMFQSSSGRVGRAKIFLE